MMRNLERALIRLGVLTESRALIRLGVLTESNLALVLSILLNPIKVIQCTVELLDCRPRLWITLP